MIAVQALEPPVFDPTDDEIAWERAYWAEQDQIAEYEVWYLAQAEAEAEEHDYSDDCGCDECHSTYDEYVAMNREYEIAIRGY